MKTTWLDRAVGPVLALIALAVYGVTLSVGAYPGVSAMLVVSHLGLYPQLTPESPLWSLLARGIGAVAGNHAVSVLNGLSAVCAAGAVALLYSLMRRGIIFFTDEYQVMAGRRRLAAVLGGASSALILAFCIPFWVVANRAHTAAVDVFLLLLLARMFVAYAENGRLVVALALALLYGVGVTEFATLIVFAPVFGMGLLYVMWKRETLRMGAVLALAGCLVVGLLTYAVASWSFYETPGYALRGYQSFGQILRYMWRDQLFLISRSLPREGWLVILFVTVAPWAAMFSVARRALNDEQEWGVYILHTLMTGLTVAVVVNSRLAPWTMLGWRRLLVTPYVLVAMTFGYLVAYWFLLPGDRSKVEWGFDANLVRLVLGRSVMLGMLGLAAWMPLQNAAFTGTQESQTINALADAVVEGLEGRTWLITDGQLDNHLLLAAQRKGIALQVINVLAGNNSLYMDYVAGLFEDIRLKNVAKLSMPSLIRAWLDPATEAAAHVAVLAYPDIWSRHGFEAIPNRLLFFGVTNLNTVATDTLVRQNESFWVDFERWIADSEASGRTNRWLDWARGRSGMGANNLGVLLEDREQFADAFRAYAAARRLDPENVSALLNMSAMVAAGRAVDANGSVGAAMKALEDGLSQKYYIWSLSRYYGTVRRPEAFAQQGWNWAYSGQPGMAIAQMERASELLPDEQKIGLQGMMADLYLMDNRSLESEAMYKSILLREPKNLKAMQGLMRIALMQGEYEKAESYRRQAEQGGLDPIQSVLVQALIETSSKEYAKARERLEILLQENRHLVRGWALLAEIGFATGDESLIDQVLRRLEGVEGARGLHVSMIRGRRAFEKKDLSASAEYFALALAQQPGDRRLIETLLRLNLALGRGDSVRQHVKALLQVQPDHALALYVRGSLQIANGEYALAEDSLRQSLRRARLPMALNDLAWLLLERNAYDEAESLVNEALAINEQQPAVWDTKGLILMRTGRAEEAETAFGRSIALFSNDPSIHLHMGEVQLALGKREAASKIVEMLEPHREQLNEKDREIFNRLRAALR